MPGAPRELSSFPPGYRRALEDLASVCAEARAAADLLEYAAGLLRGRPADPEVPPLDVVPGGGRIKVLLACRDRALDAAERVWNTLPPDVQERLQPPAALLETAE
jgi:hypothetical protein